MTTNRERLHKLETIYQASRKCPACHDAPSRVVYVDPETYEPWNESMPESGCPTCGTPVFDELIVVIEDTGSEVL